MLFHPEDAYGIKVGHLTALEPVVKNFMPSMTWRFKCDCGQIVKERLSKVLNGAITSCGCSPEDGTLIPEEPIHLTEYDRLEAMWKRVKAQCQTPSYASYARYGGKGIKLEWTDYKAFQQWAYTVGYTEDSNRKYVLRRKDDSGDFGPENCYLQAYDAGVHHVGVLITIRGVKHTIQEWADLLGIRPCCIYNAKRKGIQPWIYIRYRLTFPEQKRPKPERILEYASANEWKEETVYE